MWILAENSRNTEFVSAVRLEIRKRNECRKRGWRFGELWGWTFAESIENENLLGGGEKGAVPEKRKRTRDLEAGESFLGDPSIEIFWEYHEEVGRKGMRTFFCFTQVTISVVRRNSSY